MRRVALTASRARDESGALHPDVVPYVAAIERAGAEAFLVPNDVAGIDAILREVDGVVVGGGVDVDPVRYGGRPEHPRSQAGSYRADRDAFEIELVRATRERGVPTLAICRGLQVANVAFGGSLLEDVREALGERYTIEHRQTYESGLDRADYAPGHEVAFDPRSAFARLAGATSAPTNSMHHQAVRVVGDGLRAAGHTTDGTIEVLEATFAHPFFFAVQWHPEELADDALSLRLFTALARARRPL